MADRGDHRIGDAERQRVIDVLRSHTGAGRLSLDEFSDLAGEVYAARTYRELDDVSSHLPPGVTLDGALPPPAPGGAGPGPTSAAPVDARPRRWFVGVMGASRARKRWRAPARIGAVAFWGSVKVDLRKAEIEGPVVDVTAWALMGGVSVVVPPGTRAELDGCVVMGGIANRVRSQDAPPGGPVVRVHARGLWGGVSVRPGRDRARRSRGAHAGDAASVAPDGAHPDDRAGDHRPDHRQGLLELPQGVLDDVADLLTGILADSPPRSPVPRSPSPGPPAGSGAPSPPGTPRWPAPAGAAHASPPTGTLTMLVTDIARSTALAERLGDHRWIDVLADHNAIVREQVARHGGTEVKAQGDGFLVVFTSARRAILAAVDIQRALADFRTRRPDTPVDVRIGLHTGEIVDVDGDVLGQNVVVAVRIADEASPGEIVVSALTRDLTAAGGDLDFGPAEEVQLKGLSRPWRVHRVAWAEAT